MASVSAQDARTYQQNQNGNIRYDKPSTLISKNGRIIQTDSAGNKQSHNQ